MQHVTDGLLIGIHRWRKGKKVCVCVCVCEGERERREQGQGMNGIVICAIVFRLS